MKTVGVHQAKTNLSRILAEVETGQRYIIARAGKPVAELRPATPVPLAEVQLDLLKDQIQIPDNFDTLFASEVLEMFEGTK